MAFQPAPGIAQFNIRASLQGETVENVLHYIAVDSVGWPVARLESWAQTVGTEWAAEVMPLLSDEYTLLEVEGRDLSFEGGFIGTWVPPTLTTGLRVDPALPNNVAFCITKLTNRGGRSYRGRTYICGLTENQVTGNSLGDPFIAGLVAGLKSILIRDGGSTIGGVVLSRVNQGDTRPEAVGSVVTDVVARDGFVDSQRRRLPGR